MADTPKKTKAPAKPKKAATPTAAAAKKAAPKTAAPKKATKAAAHQAETRAPKKPAHEEILELARKFWAERGWQDGHAEQDWLRAEQELSKAS